MKKYLIKEIKKLIFFRNFLFFFYQGFLHRHWRFTGQQGKGGDLFYSTLPLPPAHQHWDVIELPSEWLIDDAIFVCLLDELMLDLCYSDLTLETGGFELASTITLALQANRLTKCASYYRITYCILKIFLSLFIFCHKFECVF